MFIVTPIVGVRYCSMFFCCTLLYVHSSVAIILMGNREMVALLNLSSLCLVIVEWLFLAVPWGCLRFVIVVFPDHTHYFRKLFCFHAVRLCVRLERFVSFISWSHRWNFIKLCKYIYIYTTNTLNKKVRARANPFRGISLCSSKWIFIYGIMLKLLYSPYMGRSTPTKVFDGAI